MDLPKPGATSNELAGKVFVTLRERACALSIAGFVLTSCGGEPSGPTTPDPVAVTAVTPNPIVAGQTATITGTGFSATPASNTVTIGGISMTVTSSTATQLQVNVPSNACLPSTAVDVRVTVAGETSNPFSGQFQSSTPPLSLAVGKQTLIQTPANFCIQFAASTANESYLIGLQSISASVTSVTAATVAGVAGGAGSNAATTTASLTQGSAFNGPVFDPAVAQSGQVERFRNHRTAELSLRRKEQAYFRTRLPQMIAGRNRAAAAMTTAANVAIPAIVNVGDTVQVRVPNTDSTDLCVNFSTVKTVVRLVGTHSVWLEDAGNPTGGFTLADFQELDSNFDSKIYDTDVAYFGQPTDMDANGRIAIVVTKEVNRRKGSLGFTWPGDLFPRAQCASSDVGEVYYGRAPDPNGMVGSAYTLAQAKNDAFLLLAHEFTHVIQFGRRLNVPGATDFADIWELEGQATLAEEVNGHVFTGRSQGRNYGFAVAFNQDAEADPIGWYLSFIDFVLYSGFDFDDVENKIAGAPEQCSWLDTEDNGNNDPCDWEGREVYGVPWLLLRWASDVYGPTFPGGEKGLQRALVDNQFTGYQTLSNVLNKPIDTILSQFAAALYVDDRVTGLDPTMTFTSWNFFNIWTRLRDTARLTPRVHVFTNFSDAVSVRGASTAYFVVSGANRPATAVRARDSSGNALPSSMRMWVVRMQ